MSEKPKQYEAGTEPSQYEAQREKRLKFLKEVADNLSAYEQLRVMLSGDIHVGDYRFPGWSGALPFYAFTCEKHGLVVNYPTGHMKKLLCPYCLEED